MENLFTSIESLCQKKDIRPGRMCDDLGISRSLMTDLKMGRKKTVNAQTARKIAEYLEVSVDFLLGQCAERVEEADILDKVDVAFFGQYKELNEEDKETVRDMVRLMRERRAAKQRE